MELRITTLASLGCYVKTIDANFWEGRRVFITGHTGFKGSWLALWLSDLGAKVYGYSLPLLPTDDFLFGEKAKQGVKSTFGDLRHLNSLVDSALASEASIVFHLGAQALVPKSFDDPVGTYGTNVMGTLNVLEACRRLPTLDAVINITSDKCYENNEWERGYKETDRLGGFDPYSSSKACSEILTSSYYRSFLADKNISAVTVRAGNVIGGGDWAPNRLMPDAIRAFSSGTSLKVRYPNSTRPWQHVLEPIGAYICLAQYAADAGSSKYSSWNIGPDVESVQSVASVTRKITELWGAGASWELDDGQHPHEAGRLALDISKATSILGWKPIWNLNTALEKTITWYLAHSKNENLYNLSIKQIRDYMNDQNDKIS